MRRPGIRSSPSSTLDSKATAVKLSHGFEPMVAISTAYTGTFCMYLLGNLLPILPELPYPLSGCLLPMAKTTITSHSLTTLQVTLALMFIFHFCRRVLETIFVHKYARTNTLFELIGAHIYYWFFAFWAGWSIRADLGYRSTPIPLITVGIILFCIGEVGNCAVHLHLRDLRKVKLTTTSAPSSRVLPQGVLFSLVSCPHYTFEILSWIGFAMASMVLASFAFLGATIVVLLKMSMDHHQRYRKDFDGRDGRHLYPLKRKALIPFIY